MHNEQTEHMVFPSQSDYTGTVKFASWTYLKGGTDLKREVSWTIKYSWGLYGCITQWPERNHHLDTGRV